MKLLTKTKLALFVVLIALLCGCKQEIRDSAYLNNLEIGDTLYVDSVKSSMYKLRVKRSNYKNTTYTDGIFYITVNTDNNIINSIWSRW